MVIPVGVLGNDTMFPASPFVLKDYIKDCNDSYGVPPRPHWVTTYYGGLVCTYFSSVIFEINFLTKKKKYIILKFDTKQVYKLNT